MIKDDLTKRNMNPELHERVPKQKKMEKIVAIGLRYFILIW